MWKEIDGYQYLYRINEDAEVQRQMEDGSWRRLRPWYGKGGSGDSGKYLYVKLVVKTGIYRKVPLVRLMEGRFIRARRNGEIISHRNGCGQDCSMWNLYHTTPEKLAKGMSPNRKSIEKISPSGDIIEIYRSIEEAANRNYISRTAVSKWCRGMIKDPFSIGFSFRYEEKPCG